MLGFLVTVAGVLVVAVLLFLGASLLLGRGEERPAGPDRSPVELPEDRPVTGDDVRALRIPVAARGYRMAEVDWLLDQFADALEERDAEIASLRARLAEQQETGAADAAPGHEQEERPGA